MNDTNMNSSPMGEQMPPAAPTTSMPTDKKAPVKMFVLGVGSTIVIVVLLALMGIVRAAHNGSKQSVVQKVATSLGVSVASINGQKIPYARYVDETDTLQKFYTKNPQAAAQFGNPTESQVSDQVMSRLLVNALVSQVAEKNNVTVSSTEFAAARAQLVKTFPTEADADKQLQDSYGWSLDKYMDEVVKPTLLEKDLQSWFLARTDDEAKKYQVDEVHAKHILFPVAAGADDAKVKATAEAVLARIKKGEDFDKVGNDLALKDQAKKLEPGVSGVIMEDLGWFGHGRMVKEFETAAFAAKAGDLIGPIKTNFGYHIIHVIEKRRANSFETYMQEELKKASIVIFGSIHNPFEQLLGGTASSTDNATVTPDSAQ